MGTAPFGPRRYFLFGYGSGRADVVRFPIQQQSMSSLILYKLYHQSVRGMNALMVSWSWKVHSHSVRPTSECLRGFPSRICRIVCKKCPNSVSSSHFDGSSRGNTVTHQHFLRRQGTSSCSRFVFQDLDGPCSRFVFLVSPVKLVFSTERSNRFVHACCFHILASDQRSSSSALKSEVRSIITVRFFCR